MQCAIWAFNKEKFATTHLHLAVWLRHMMWLCLPAMRFAWNSLIIFSRKYFRIYSLDSIRSGHLSNALISIPLPSFDFNVKTSSNVVHKLCEWNDHFDWCMWFHSSVVVCWLLRFDFSLHVFTIFFSAFVVLSWSFILILSVPFRRCCMPYILIDVYWCVFASRCMCGYLATIACGRHHHV